MKKIVFALTIFSFLFTSVSADTLPLSGYDGRADIFDISTGTGSIVIEPESCTSIDKITFDLSEKIDAQLTIRTLGDKIEDMSGPVSKVYEYCSLKSDKEVSTLSNIFFEVKVRKSWLVSNDLQAENLSFYSHNNEEGWRAGEIQNTNTDDEFFVVLTVKLEKLDSLYAVGEKQIEVNQSMGLNLNVSDLNPNLIIICCCCGAFLLLLMFLTFTFFTSRNARRGGYENE